MKSRVNNLADLVKASVDGNTEQLRRILATNIKLDRVPTGSDRDAITAAATEGNTNVVQLLIDAGAAVDGKKRGNFPLSACFESWYQNRDHRAKYVPTLKLLLRRGAEPTPGMFVKVVMCELDEDLLVAFLEAAKSWPWYQRFLEEGGCGLVRTAASMGDIALNVLQMLLQSGANPNHVNIMTGTALGGAINLKRIRSVEMLLAHGADPDLADHLGATPLLLAARSGSVEIVRLLLISKADVNRFGDCKLSDELIETRLRPGEIHYEPFPTLCRTTPLIIATRLGHLEVVAELLNVGADKTLMAADGKTAIDWAREGNLAEISKLLDGN